MPDSQLSSGVESANYTGGATVDPALAWGYNDHFWVTMSYADTLYGAINTARLVCTRYLPGWICGSIANVLQWLVNGWGYANNHGVWAAAYWSGYVTGGRW